MNGTFRGLAVAIALTVGGTAAGALPASAAESPGGGSAANGGTVFHLTPAISRLECTSLCGGTGGAARRPRAVVVREGGALRVAGRNLDAVTSVVFLGGSGRSDDAKAPAAAAGARALQVSVPATASSGRLVLVDSAGHRSRPSANRVRIVHPPVAPGGSAPVASQGFAWPVRGSITGVFGENRGDHRHSGLDIAAPGGTPIRAAAAGTVSLIGPTGGYGLFTCIRHVALTTCYAHQSRFGTQLGASVRKGQVIGYVGNTGNSFGDHLHFEVRRGTNPWSAPLNPLSYLPRR